MKRLLTVLAIAVAGMGVVAPQALAQRPDDSKSASHFGFIFDQPPFTSPTTQEIADLAQTMLDPNADSENNANMDSIYTYFGQFIDHDLTLDTSPQPTAPTDPTTLINSRTFKFDLDSVYGGGPGVNPELYDADKLHFKVQNPNPNGVIDLPRNADGSAILVEKRNDENEILSQIHVAFLLNHNKLIDSGLGFNAARQKLVEMYQEVVLGEVLPHFVTAKVVTGELNNTLKRHYKPGNPNRPMTPVEFSVAAYRFGHSMVRRAYELTNTTGKIQVFSATLPDLRGGRQLPAGRQIDWGNFIEELTRPENVAHVNISRKIDPLISSSLFVLPIPGAEATGSNVLAFRNMTRADFYGMASGQDVAKAMGIPAIDPDVIVDNQPAFGQATPLWYYILAESSRTQNGKFLGPVGGRIVADVFVRIMQIDKDSILKGNRVTINDEDSVITPKGEAERDMTGLEDIFIRAGLAKAVE
jgi:Animal haem peroxidase